MQKLGMSLSILEILYLFAIYMSDDIFNNFAEPKAAISEVVHFKTL